MIYIGFVLDFLIVSFLPINTYFVIAELDKNNVLRVILIGLILDLIFKAPFFNVLIFLSIYIVLKILKISKKYIFFKNIVVYLIYFNLTYFLFGHSINYLTSFFISMILQIIYLKLSDVLLN